MAHGYVPSISHASHFYIWPRHNGQRSAGHVRHLPNAEPLVNSYVGQGYNLRIFSKTDFGNFNQFGFGTRVGRFTGTAQLRLGRAAGPVLPYLLLDSDMERSCLLLSETPYLY